jgi:hypothetical protein
LHRSPLRFCRIGSYCGWRWIYRMFAPFRKYDVSVFYPKNHTQLVYTLEYFQG